MQLWNLPCRPQLAVHSLAKHIVQCFEMRGIIKPSQDEREIYVYGFELAIYTLVSTLGLLIIGFLFGYPLETCLIITLFYVNQTLGGGFHASSHLSCFLSMCAGLVAILILLQFSFPNLLFTGIGIGSLLVLYFNPLVLHKNKQFLQFKSPYFIKRSRIAVLIQLFLFILSFCFSLFQYVKVYALSLALCSISRLIAVTKNKRSTVA